MSATSEVLGARLRAGEPAAHAEVEAVLRAERGSIAAAARRLGVPLRTLAAWVARTPALRFAVVAARAAARAERVAGSRRAVRP